VSSRRLPRCVLDSGGLTALVGRSADARALLRWVVEHAVRVRIPVAILSECVTGDGARDAEVNRILGMLERAEAALVAADELVARHAGRLRYLARGDDGIDAIVAACAVGDGSPAVVLTSDPADMQRLLSRSRNVTIRKV